MSNKHNEEIKYKQPKRIETLPMICSEDLQDEIMRNRYKLNEVICSFNRYECLLEKSDKDE